jgi:beta-lactamase regulating signal transducer with metallopeptidase domain
MDKLFLSVLNMSLTASFVIAAIALARFALHQIRAPKAVAYALWAVALFNLLCPFKPPSVFSLNPLKPAPIPLDIGMQAAPRIDSGVTVLNNAASAVLSAATPAAGANPLQIWTGVGAYLWAFGVAAMLIYAVASYVLLKRKLRFATKRDGNVFETDGIRSPFVLGFINPKIYLPVGLADSDLGYILCHERTHVKRRDYLVKPVAFFALALHWFNPLVWLAYFLLNADMEMSCDERVLRELGGEVKTVYSTALLNLAAGRRLAGLSPLAFGEGGVKERVKNVMDFKKRSRVIVVAAVALVAVLSVGFAVGKADGGGNSFGFANFKVNGFGLGMDVDSIDTSALTPAPPLNSKDGYAYNFSEARYSADETTRLLRKMQVNVYDGAEIPSVTMNNGNAIMNPSDVLRNIEQVETLLGNGASGWQDREQGMRYVEYSQKEGRLAATVRFVYSDKNSDGIDHRLVWIIAESSFPYPMPILDYYVTVTEAQAMAAERYPDAKEIRYTGEEFINYTNPPKDVGVFTFDVTLSDGSMERCAVSKDGRIFFTYYADTNGDMIWGVNTGTLEWPPENRRQMTLADVRGLAQKIGTRLTLNDLRDFIGEDIGSGLFVMQYEVEGGEYRLIVGAGNREGRVDYARFGKAIYGNIDENYIDMRYYNVDKYIADGTRELVSELSELSPDTLPAGSDFSVTPEPNSYALAMSSAGIGLRASGGASGVGVQYTCESGSFGEQTGDAIQPLGNFVERDAGSLVFWRPDGYSKDGDRVNVSLIAAAGDSPNASFRSATASVGFLVATDGMYYSLSRASAVSALTADVHE